MPDLGGIKAGTGRLLRQRLQPAGRWLSREYRRESESLAAYSGLVRQAFRAEPFRPWVVPDVHVDGLWHPHTVLAPQESPARRERDNAIHHYGHDVVLKRWAGLPPVGRPLPVLLEHGVKFSPDAAFEKPEPWTRIYLCMGEQRAAVLRQRHGLPAEAVGPFLRYAQPVLAEDELEALRQRLGPCLLVIPPHSLDRIPRHWDQQRFHAAVDEICARRGFRSVIWMGHWKDGLPPDLPAHWIPACNGHRSNPWFLDAQRTVFALAGGMVTCALGTHVGYAQALGVPILLLKLAVEQDFSGRSEKNRLSETQEWDDRASLIEALAPGLEQGEWTGLDPAEVTRLLDPYFGFARHRDPATMARLLTGET
jgi:hypothetical protein